MATTLQERARILVDELALLGVDQVDIAVAAGVTKGSVNQWLTGAIKSMKLQYALGIEKRYGYNHKWLVMGDEPKKLDEIKQPDDSIDEPVRLHGQPHEYWPFSPKLLKKVVALTDDQRGELEVEMHHRIEMMLERERRLKELHADQAKNQSA